MIVMKIKLLIFSLLLTTLTVSAQIVSNHVDDFEDNTVQGWNIDQFGAGAPNPPTNVNTGGPDGVDDNFLQYVTTGNGGGPGSKMIIFQFGSEWMGNYTTASIAAIKLNVKAEASNLNLRVAFNGAGGEICTTNAVVVTAGTGWNFVTIPISASDFTTVDGGTDPAATLANVTEMRILSSPNPAWRGEVFSGVPTTMQLDNITASTTLSISDFTKKEFSISPNPASSKLNVFLPNNFENANITVFDILGKKVYNRTVNGLTSKIDVSKWNSGVYLVRVSNDNATQTKRFVKQ
jgi:hypothetical protein